LDHNLIQCAVLSAATGLAEFGSQGQDEESLVGKALNDTVLMKDMLVVGGPQDGKYGEAMAIYDKITKSSSAIVERAAPTCPWDDRPQKTILHRLAVGTAVAHVVPLAGRYNKEVVDPVKRYLHYEKAYLAGDLDPAVAVPSAFECKHAVDCRATDDELAWMRRTMKNYRPDHIARNNSNNFWRYAEAVRTEVEYGDSVWFDLTPGYTNIPAAGGVCVARAWFGRFTRKTWGLPTCGVQEPGHAATTTWSATYRLGRSPWLRI
jgi:hypothetical protein